MPKFKLSALVGVSAFTVVEAETLEEAIEEAESRDVRLQLGPGDRGRNESWIIDEADGMPMDISEE